MKIYVASSWRNAFQPQVVALLRAAGHSVYDFRNPEPGDKGFSWRQCKPDDEPWSPAVLQRVLTHPVATRGYNLDLNGMCWADGCVLVLPCGRSAHLEAGWMIGKGKPTVIYAPELPEPELMYLLAGPSPLALTPPDLMRWAGDFDRAEHAALKAAAPDTGERP